MKLVTCVKFYFQFRILHLNVINVTDLCAQNIMTYPGNSINMVDCGNLRCFQERRLIKKDLMSWSKKIPILVGKYSFSTFQTISIFFFHRQFIDFVNFSQVIVKILAIVTPSLARFKRDLLSFSCYCL